MSRSQRGEEKKEEERKAGNASKGRSPGWEPPQKTLGEGNQKRVIFGARTGSNLGRKVAANI